MEEKKVVPEVDDTEESEGWLHQFWAWKSYILSFINISSDEFLKAPLKVRRNDIQNKFRRVEGILLGQ
jgi:hypothetical protein